MLHVMVILNLSSQVEGGILVFTTKLPEGPGNFMVRCSKFNASIVFNRAISCFATCSDAFILRYIMLQDIVATECRAQN